MLYNNAAANAAKNFFEDCLKHTADEYYGEPFKLVEWEDKLLHEVFGRCDAQNNSIIEQVYAEVPKKSGKTELAAGLVLYTLCTSTMPGCQVYGAAAATRQALNVYRAACKMVEQSPLLQQMLRIMRGTNRIVKRTDYDSFYAAIAADGDFGDGVNPAFIVADEVHRWKTRKQLENWDVLSKGGITRKKALTIAITTAGVASESPLAWKLHDKTVKINQGIVTDERFFGVIYAADPTDDPGDPATWRKANPSLKPKGFLDESRIKKEYDSAVAEGDLTSFKRYFLNIWDQKENRAVDLRQWDACPAPWIAKGLGEKKEGESGERVRPLAPELFDRFKERVCWPGVDLSMSSDLSAVVFLFPDKDEYFDVLPFFWLPSAKMRKLEIKLSVPLKRWSEQGLLEVSQGEVIDYHEIQDRLRWAGSVFDMQEICWDPWNSRQASVELLREGYACHEIRQGYQSLNEATKKILESIAQGKLRHGNHPIMRWHAGCACTDTDGKDNIIFSKPDREKETSRIDGMAALANAFAGYFLSGGDRRNVYESRGLRVL